MNFRQPLLLFSCLATLLAHCSVRAYGNTALPNHRAVLQEGVDAQEATPAPKTVAVEQGPFSVILALQGNFDEPDAEEIACKPQVYQGALEVVEAIAPGVVSKGQLLVRFDPEEIDAQIVRANLDLEIARANFARQTQQTRHQEESLALQSKTSEQIYEHAKQTFETFRDVLMPTRLEEAELSMQSSRDYLKDQEAQFEQLLKMYQSDDLVEETEDIVIARERRGLEQQRQGMVFSQRRHELMIRFDLPAELEGYSLAFERARIDWELNKTTTDLTLSQARAELRKTEIALERQQADLSKLIADRDALSVRAPNAGLAVAGQLVQGKWSQLVPGGAGLRAETRVNAGQVLYSIVQQAPTIVRARVPEAALLDLEAGKSAVVTPEALRKTRLPATVKSVNRVSADGQYDVVLELRSSDSALLPGHACAIDVTVLKLDQALTIPESALRKDGEQTFVWLAEPEPRPVEISVGRSSQGRVQVLSGLTAGRLVLEQAPAKQ